MTEQRPSEPGDVGPTEGRPPLGSWPLTYLVILSWSAGVIALLRWLTTSYNQGLG